MISIFLTASNINLNCDTSEVNFPVQITSENFDKEVLNSEIPVILYVYEVGSWSCRVMHPIFAELCQEFTGKMKFATMDVDKNESLADELDVRYVPTFLLYYKSEMVAASEGSESKEEFEQMCEEALKMCAEIDAENLTN